MGTDAPQSVHAIGTNLGGFADALDQLGKHALSMTSGDSHVRDDCVYCQATIMLSRVVAFGEQLRSGRRQ